MFVHDSNPAAADVERKPHVEQPRVADVIASAAARAVSMNEGQKDQELGPLLGPHLRRRHEAPVAPACQESDADALAVDGYGRGQVLGAVRPADELYNDDAVTRPSREVLGRRRLTSACCD